MRIARALSLLFLAGCGAGTTAASSPYPPAPDVELIRRDGSTLKLSEYRGKKYVVLLFLRGFTGDFACMFCSKQTMEYRAAAREFADAGAEVIEVLPGTPEPKMVQPFLDMVADNDDSNPPKPLSVPFLVVVDPSMAATHAFGVPTVQDEPFPVRQPATVIIDLEGRVRVNYLGKDVMDRPAASAVLAEIRRAKAGEPPKLGAPPPPTPAGDSGIAWEPSLEKGLARARDEQKPLLVDFYADW
jgi:peroxiredoxin